MENIKKYFDDFTFHARVMPVLVVLLPVLVMFIYKGLLSDDLIQNTIMFSVVIIFLSFTSKIAREKGKNHESKMYKNLGGMPTTIVLRYTDNTFDSLTKTRYHQKINRFVEGVNLPLNIENEDGTSDEQYQSAINSLRNYANSNRDKEPRVYQELKDYNFWRNLYGTKIFALIVYTLIAIREVILMDTFSIKLIFLKPYPQYIALIIMLLSIILFCICITAKTVERKAFDYAKTLVEVSERI